MYYYKPLQIHHETTDTYNEKNPAEMFLILVYYERMNDECFLHEVRVLFVVLFA